MIYKEAVVAMIPCAEEFRWEHPQTPLAVFSLISIASYTFFYIAKKDLPRIFQLIQLPHKIVFFFMLQISVCLHTDGKCHCIYECM